jgi:hypothetical protein
METQPKILIETQPKETKIVYNLAIFYRYIYHNPDDIRNWEFIKILVINIDVQYNELFQNIAIGNKTFFVEHIDTFSFFILSLRSCFFEGVMYLW